MLERKFIIYNLGSALEKIAQKHDGDCMGIVSSKLDKCNYHVKIAKEALEEE